MHQNRLNKFLEFDRMAVTGRQNSIRSVCYSVNEIRINLVFRF